ncbi:hypothetical protein J40TS1_29280 [Paenibacillus montaniterrae]|uniref:HTH araC/xylS-type domain-containing protein n=1 Tax=Paenibacillus montaniterrae TaxID=429341 RepID=A0A920CXV1_9BACL|nr:AraC family transcriptional regulator [Paenibacillus montaniterrae]GIP17286.1 hypothetical protein J40TS1_29280 [Paenibacillus montaniterrae]
MKIKSKLQYGNPLEPLYVEYNRRKGHFSMQSSHMHSHYELYYLFAGQRVYFIKDRSYTIQAGDFVIIPSDVVHRTLDSGVPDHERMVLYFNDSYFAQFPSADAELLLAPFRSSHHIFKVMPGERLQLEQRLYTMLHEIQEQPPGYRLTVQHTAAAALLYVARQMQHAEPDPAADQLSPTEAKMMEVAQYINAHFRETLTLELLSSKFFLSESYLSRTFKKLTGFAFTEYVGMTRVKEAQKLLRETDKRITDISEEVGFGSFAHFEKVFKELTRLSPREYRSQFRDQA